MRISIYTHVCLCIYAYLRWHIYIYIHIYLYMYRLIKGHSLKNLKSNHFWRNKKAKLAINLIFSRSPRQFTQHYLFLLLNLPSRCFSSDYFCLPTKSASTNSISSKNPLQHRTWTACPHSFLKEIHSYLCFNTLSLACESTQIPGRNPGKSLLTGNYRQCSLLPDPPSLST